MDWIQITALILLCVFYIAYVTKTLILKRHGITANLLGKGDKPKAARTVEVCLRATTAAGAVTQFGSALFPDVVWSVPLSAPIRVIGLFLILCGSLFFIAAALIMRDNWRAGFGKVQNTSLVTHGIYKTSRNPAFVGFDLLFIGCAAVFPNVVSIAVALAAVILFHIQILGEEKYLVETFGLEYTRYQSIVRRYL